MDNPVEMLVDQAKGIIFSYTEEYAAAHTTFAEKMWPQKKRRRDPAYNRWKFRGPASGTVDGLLVAVVNDQVVGQLGLIPVTLRIKGKDYPAQWACDLMVDHTFRRKGLGSLLLAAGMARPVITLGSNPNKAAYIVESRLGFKPMQGPRSMFLPLEPSQAVRFRLPAHLKRFAPWISKLVRPLIALRTKKMLSVSPNIPVDVVHWSQIKETISNQDIRAPHILHDTAFLEWRCQGITGFSPELTAITAGSRSFAVFQATPSYFYVYEWKTNSFLETQALFKRLTEVALAHASQTIMVLANLSQEHAWLDKLGFFTSRNPVQVIYFPDEPLRGFDTFHYCHYDSDGNV